MRHERVEVGGGWAQVVDDGQRPVEVGSQLVPALIQIHLPGSAGQPQIDILIDSTSGVPRCREVRLMAIEGGPEVRTKDVRLLDLDEVTSRVVPVFATSNFTIHEDGSITAQLPALPDSRSEEYRTAVRAVREVRRATRRRVWDDTLLQRVADTYRGNPDRPAKAVELTEGVSRATAARYIKAAREAEFLEGRES